MTKIFVAGGAGFIGSNLIRNLINEGHEVFSFDQNIQYFYPLKNTAIRSLNYSTNIIKDAELIRGSTSDIFDLKRVINKIDQLHNKFSCIASSKKCNLSYRRSI